MSSARVGRGAAMKRVAIEAVYVAFPLGREKNERFLYYR